ncbi:OmpA family protein [Bacteroidota bacterium]
MKNIKYFAVLALLCCITHTSFAQKGKEARGNEAYDAGEYNRAVFLYKDAYTNMSDKEKKKEVLFKIANCYRLMNDSKKTEMWFNKVIKKDYPNPVVYLYMAEALKMNSKYDEAIEYYNKYKELVPDDPKADDGLESCQFSKQWLENPSGYQVQEMKYFNSKQNDFSPVFASEDYSTVFFTSLREEATGNSKHGATGYSFADIFSSTMDRKGKWSTPIPLGENINTEFEDGVCSFNSDYSTLYFTRCEVDKKSKMGCKIFYASKRGSDWSKPEVIKIIDDSLIAAHPAISPDELTLYFTSNMPGGFGGKDIWMIKRENTSAEFGAPINMGGEINTEGDEVFPYMHNDGTFYFASNGHIGMGGLDIFKAKLNEKDLWEVENMRFPISSPSDDFGIVYESDKERGFFTSGRDGKNGADDIFSFYLPPLKFSISGLVKDAKTDEEIPASVVKLIGSDGTTLTNESLEDGTFKFMLRANTDYIFIFSKKGYLNGKAKETTKGLGESKDFYTTIHLSAIDKPIVVPNIFYDFGKYELRPESMVALDNLVEVLRDNPTVTIELGSHTDSRGSDEFNIELSQKRAQSVVDYLIQKGIQADRLTAKGYAATMPILIDKRTADTKDFLHEGDVLSPEYINGLPTEDQQEAAHYFNRRTEFKVLRTDYGNK